jgi:fibronectin-binding autotransporter adhesin
VPNTTLSIAALWGPIVINDVIQQPTGIPGNVAINPQANGNGTDQFPVTLNAANTYTGTTTLGGAAFTPMGPVLLGASSNALPGTLFIAGPFGTGPLVMNNTTSPPTLIPIGADRTVANAITMTSGFSAATATAAQDPTGAHNLTLTGPITLGATSRVLNSNLAAGVALSLGSAASPSAISLGSALVIQTQQTTAGAGTTVINDAVSGTGGLTVQSGTVQLNGAASTYSGATTINGLTGIGGATVQIGASSNSPFTAGPFGTGTVTVGGGSTPSPTLQAVTQDQTVANAVTMAGNFTVSGSFSLTLTGALTNSGGDNALTNAIGVGGKALTLGNVVLSENGATAGRTMTIGGTGTTVVAGVIADGAQPSNLTVSGGIVRLNSANAYTGTTMVSGGTLAANNGTSGSATGSGPVLINNGAVLSGTGTFGGAANGNATLSAGAAVQPGTNNAGTLAALGSVTLTGGTNSNWLVGINSGTSGNAANLLSLTGAGGVLNFATAGGTYNIEFEQVGGPAFTVGAPVTYTIATVATAGNIQQNGSTASGTLAGFTFTSSSIQFLNPSLSVSGTNLVLTFTPVPEPSHLLLCGAAAGAAGWWRRRLAAGDRS